ncbi:dihydroxyacetone kinase, partial [Lacticaseibacillus rhamnosus MTCC 5462]
ADLIKQGKLDDAAIDKLVEATKPMTAKRGRASYLGEKVSATSIPALPQLESC